MDMEAVIRQLQDTMVVMAEIQRRQAAVLKDQAEWIAGQEMRTKEIERQEARHAQKMAEFDDKLNALIPIVDAMIRGKQQ